MQAASSYEKKDGSVEFLCEEREGMAALEQDAKKVGTVFSH